MKKLMCVVFMVCLFASSRVWSTPSEWADMLMKAHQRGQPIPVLSTQSPLIDVKTAYQIQHAYVRKRLADEKIVGFKAGLTSEAGQKRFGVDAPLAGVLFKSGKQAIGSTIGLSSFKDLRIETEIGFVIEKAITQPMKDVAELQEKIQTAMPVIELPDLGFADMNHLQGVDIIAANVAAAQFIVGKEKGVEDLELNAISVTLSLDGNKVNSGQGADALGAQWNAALWLVNTMVEQGYSIAPGNIIITGALGKMLPGKPGKYIADYGSFGEISFEIGEQ